MSKIYSTGFFEIPTDRSVSELMRENYSNTPAQKIIFEDTLTGKTATYEGIRDQVASLASGLVKIGLKHGDILTTISPSCVDYVAVAQAVWHAGGTLCPMNHSMSVKELTAALSLVRPKFVVVHGDKIYVDRVRAAMKASNLHNASLATLVKRNDDLPLATEDWSQKSQQIVPCFSLQGKDARKVCAAILLSSGTTGLPKAVRLSHHNIVASCEMMRRHNTDNWNGNQIEVFFPPLSHIYGFYACITMTYWLGSYTTMMPAFDLEQYIQLLDSKRATLARMLPVIAKMLSETPLVARHNFDSLKAFSISGSPLMPKVVTALKAKFPNTAITQTYGCTELTGMIAQTGPRDGDRPLSAGKLMLNVQIRFLDADGKDDPDGKGEIVVKTETLFLGYLNNPEATSETIVDGWFKTGDIGVWDGEGHIRIVDRIKDIIKYKGFQVSPSELEAVIIQHPAVNEVCVVGIWDEEMSTEIPRACVVKHPQYSVPEKKAEEEIVALVKEKVAGYKALRGGVSWVKSLAKSGNGKILRREVRDLEVSSGNVVGYRPKL